MNDFLNLLELNVSSIISGIFVIMSGFIAAYTIIGKFSEIIKKPVFWVSQKNKDHELLENTVKRLDELESKHKTDIKTTENKNDQIEEKLALFMDEMRTEMKQYIDNRIHDRQQSREIQKELTEAISEISQSNQAKGKQIDSLIIAQKEMMAEKINEKYKHYIAIKGIPEDEYEEFVSLHKAYNGVGGNHKGDAKFNYCMEHLEVLPVETKLEK